MHIAVLRQSRYVDDGMVAWWGLTLANGVSTPSTIARPPTLFYVRRLTRPPTLFYVRRLTRPPTLFYVRRLKTQVSASGRQSGGSIRIHTVLRCQDYARHWTESERGLYPLWIILFRGSEADMDY